MFSFLLLLILFFQSLRKNKFPSQFKWKSIFEKTLKPLLSALTSQTLTNHSSRLLPRARPHPIRLSPQRRPPQRRRVRPHRTFFFPPPFCSPSVVPPFRPYLAFPHLASPSSLIPHPSGVGGGRGNKTKISNSENRGELVLHHLLQRLNVKPRSQPPHSRFLPGVKPRENPGAGVGIEFSPSPTTKRYTEKVGVGSNLILGPETSLSACALELLLFSPECTT